MEILVILVAGAGLSAAWAWWRLARPIGRGNPGGRKATRLIGFADTSGETTGDIFVFAPAAAPAVDDDRPPPAMSVARLALTIALSAAALVAVAWTIGFLIKMQLDRYFLAGG